MKKMRRNMVVLIGSLILVSGCSTTAADLPATTEQKDYDGAIMIELSDEKIKVDGQDISMDDHDDVYLAHDIVYYEEGKDFTYGEGTEQDAHSLEEAESHAVVHIRKAGSYVLSGKLSAGQIAVDLGEEAEDDPTAVVTLILNGVDLTCSCAPAVIFYNVYECGSKDEETASAFVDTSHAGANVVIADGTVNTVKGSYVARIYKPGSVELNEDNTEVVDAKKLHKYDAAFYSKQSMNIDGESSGTGLLMILAENEGLDSELHLTINGGHLQIESGNDGINTNEDGISVTTVNGGIVDIAVNGSTGEGDGIDSNGWLVINGGTVKASACGFSGDAGIDSDMGIHIHGGTVMASGNMLDHIAESTQPYAVFSFASSQMGNQMYTLKDASLNSVVDYTAANDFSILVVSSDQLIDGIYTLWQDDVQFSGSKGQMMSGFGGMRPGSGEFSKEDFSGERPEGMHHPDTMKPEQIVLPEGEVPEKPDGMEWPDREMPEGELPADMGRPQWGRNPQGMMNAEAVETFEISGIENTFSGIRISESQ